MTKTFTLSEAQTLLPVLEALLRRAQSATAREAEATLDLQRLNHKIFLTGGLHVNISLAARRQAERLKAAQEAKNTLEEIEEIGVRVQNLEEGLLDFPFQADGRTVLLCWQLGEPSIAHWHAENDSVDQRRPVETLIAKSERPRPN